MMKGAARIVVCLWLLMPCLLAAQERWWETGSSASLKLQSRVIAGLTREFVNDDTGVLSRLDWQERAIAPSIEADFRLAGFGVRLSFLGALPSDWTQGLPLMGTSMEDRDWMSANHSQLTNFSKHDLTLTRHIDGSIAFNYQFSGDFWYCTPGIGFQGRRRAWEGYDGYMEYPPGSTPVPWSGPIINYTQTFWMPFLAADAGFAVTDFLDIGLAVRFYPWMKIETLDEHLHPTKLVDYRDEIENALGGRAAITFDVHPGSGALSFYLEMAAEALKADGGTSQIRDNGTSTQPNPNATYVRDSESRPGTDSLDFSVALGVRLAAPF